MSAGIYDNWKISTWQTPISNFESSRLELLMDSDQLVIIIQEGAGNVRKRVKFVFNGDYAYRNINESFRNDLWAMMPSNLGQTLVVENSDFLNVLLSDGLGKDAFSQTKHYVFKTEDDVIEVVATSCPNVQILENVDSETPPPGKSKIFYK